MAITKQLHFDVPRSLHEFFHKDIWTAERSERFATSLFVLRSEFRFFADDAHAPSAAAVSCFQDHRKSERLRQRESFIGVDDCSLTSAQNRHARLRGNFTSDRLVTETVQRFDARSDERDPVVRARLS